MATIEIKYDLLALEAGKLNRLAELVGEREVGRRLKSLCDLGRLRDLAGADEQQE